MDVDIDIIRRHTNHQHGNRISVIVPAQERDRIVLGITGVPTFVFDGQYTISGAQEVGTLAQILDQVADLTAARDVAS